MANRSYSEAFKREVVALARVIGADTASAQYGINGKDTVRRWMAQAGVAADLPGDPATWERLRDLALAKAEAMVAAGKLTAVQIATIGGIASRNADRAAARAGSDEPGAIAARDAYFDWLVDRIELPDELNDTMFTEYEQAFLAIQSELLGRANAELRADRPIAAWNPEGSHRLALLHWYNDAEDTRAGDILAWAQEQTLAIVADHGSLLGWYRWSEAMTERDQGDPSACRCRLAGGRHAPPRSRGIRP